MSGYEAGVKGFYSEFGLWRHKDFETSVHIAIYYVFMWNWIIEKEMGDIS